MSEHISFILYELADFLLIVIYSFLDFVHICIM